MNQNYTQKKKIDPHPVRWPRGGAAKHASDTESKTTKNTLRARSKMVPRWSQDGPRPPGDHRRMLSEKHAPKRRLFHLLCLHRCLRYDTARPEPFSIKLRKFKATKESQANPNLYLWSRLLRDGADSRIQSNHICLQAQPVARWTPSSSTKSQDQTQWENHKQFGDRQW